MRRDVGLLRVVSKKHMANYSYYSLQMLEMAVHICFDIEIPRLWATFAQLITTTRIGGKPHHKKNIIRIKLFSDADRTMIEQQEAGGRQVDFVIG